MQGADKALARPD